MYILGVFSLLFLELVSCLIIAKFLLYYGTTTLTLDDDHLEVLTT